jgi:DNA polymerase I-like protein with 3'-5' exonuclease and polymerase domains
MQPQITPGRRYGVQDRRPIITFDVETECAVEGCEDKACRHALKFNQNRITVLAATDGLFNSRVFRGPQLVAEFLSFVREQDAHLNAHNGKFDFEQVIYRGFPVEEALERWTEDTSLLAFIHQNKIPDDWMERYEMKRRELNALRTGIKHREAGRHSLKTLAPYYLQVQPFWEPEHSHDDDAYVMKDADYAHSLLSYFQENLPARSLDFYYDRFLPWVKHLMLMELEGICLDTEEVEQRLQKTEGRIVELQEAVAQEWNEHFDAWKAIQLQDLQCELAAKLEREQKSEKRRANFIKTFQRQVANIESLNLDSPSQLKWLLKERLKLNVTTLDGDESTDKETLGRLAKLNPTVAKLAELRKARKLVTAFYPEYLARAKDGRIFTNFNATTARTGRLSSSEPNLQQVPGHAHDLFTASPGNLLITRDLSAIEPAVLAYYSEDPLLCELIISGGDFHGTNAHAMFSLECNPSEVKHLYPDLRKVAKECGLAVLYGAGGNRIFQVLQKHGLFQYTIGDAKRFVQRLRDIYNGVWKFKLELDAKLERKATLYNLMGRPFTIPDTNEIYMKGLNTLIQGSASDLMQQKALDVRNKLGIKPLLLVHDEVIIEAPEANIQQTERRVIELMSSEALETSYGKIPIRTEGKVARVWAK